VVGAHAALGVDRVLVERAVVVDGLGTVDQRGPPERDAPGVGLDGRVRSQEFGLSFEAEFDRLAVPVPFEADVSAVVRRPGAVVGDRPAVDGDGRLVTPLGDPKVDRDGTVGPDGQFDGPFPGELPTYWST
jgi:hypothetical protein